MTELGLTSGSTVHASCVAVDDRGLLILGASGAGKSALALQLMALDAELVSDDLVRLDAAPGWPVARSPNPDVAGIEARGVGILPVALRRDAPVRAVLDLDQVEAARFPAQTRQITVCGVALPLLFRVEGPHFPAAVLIYLRGLT